MTINHYPDASPAPIAQALLFSQWRILVSGTLNGTYVNIGELEFRETVGVPQQATGGTPSANSRYSALYDAMYAFDNDPVSSWNSVGGDAVGAWLRYDFPTDRAVKQVKIFCLNTAPAAQQCPSGFKVQYFSAGQWLDAATFTGLTWTPGETKLFTI